MRELLLTHRVNHSPLFKKLRQLLVLTTLFLILPQAAWGAIYNSGTLNTTDPSNITWGAWKLSDGAGFSTNGTNNLSFTSSTITLTLPANPPEVIQSISIEIGDGYPNTHLQSAMIGTTDITNLFSDPSQTGGIYTYTPTNPAEWTGNIVITLEVQDNQGSYAGSILSAYVQTAIGYKYDLYIDGTQVTSSNATDVLVGTANAGKVSYEASSNTLSLNDASLRKIRTEISGLTIDLTGANSITTVSPDSSAIQRAILGNNDSGASISLFFSGTGYITLTPQSGYRAINSTFNVDLTPNGMYPHGSLTTNSTAVTIAKKYDLTVASTQVTCFNASNVLAGVSFTPASTGNNNVNTLTLNGASFDGSIVSGLANLTVLIKGNNTIALANNSSVFESSQATAPLTFTKEGDAKLTISSTYSSNRAPLIKGFNSIEYSAGGLSLISPMPVKYTAGGGLLPAYREYDMYTLNSVTFTTATVYPLWIANTQITEANKDNITNEATAVATFTPANGSNKAKLSLSDATINGHIISGVGDLEIYFSGANTVTSNDSSALIRPMESNANLYFTSNSNSSLILDHIIGANTYATYSVIHSYNSIVLGDGTYQETKAPSTYDNSSYSGLKNAANGSPLYYLKLSTSPTYPLWVAGTQATSTTLNGTGWTYDNDNKKLSLSGANLNGSIISGLGDLTIDIEGANTIAVSDTASVIRSTSAGKLTITKTGNNPSLVLNNTRDSQISYHAPSIKDFASFELAEGLYLSNTRAYTYNNYETPAVYDTYINNYGGQTTMGLIDPTDMDKGSKGIRDVTFSTTVSYPIWVAGKQVTPANAGAIFSNVSFTPASSANENVNTLKFTGATLSDAIVTSLNNLTVEFSGDNVLGNAGGQYGFFHGSDPNAILTFKALTNDAKIELHAANSYAVVEGFGNVAFDKAVAEYTESFSYNTTSRRYINDNGDLQLLYIKSPTAPTMGYNDQEKVTLGKAYLDGDIYYDITYAEAGKTNETGVKYTAPFALEAPATVEAWVVANGATSTKAKGKHFGYEGAPFTMLANDTKTPVLIPAIETGDNITFNYSSSDDNIATFANGVISAKAFGNATLTTSMETTGTAILNDNTQIKTVVKVAKDITGISFSGNAQYSSYCNTDADDLTLPNGIKAYAVKIPTSGNEVVLSEIGFIPGTVNSQNPIYTPILLKRDDTSKTSFGTVTKYVRESGYTLPSNDLKFTTAGENTNGKECYILYKDAFVKATGTIAQYRCYLEKPSTNPNPARGFVIEGGDDGSTAIDDTLINEEETGNGEWYDLQGRRIQKPTKPGLYIVNGKKVVVTNK